ncbi:selenocysteine-specific translation elongation factor [Neotabrizicola sp. sgz301269]|uniref:selenocysteine-specific translation elongation factor n=1 Tax=Neotabrizicola sp. sgz301269 TaxID=3276282 RepID=UPI00376FC228
MIVGTAGHIDHGKTALVKALTGVDADRLAEEKARGITIDLGFAYADLGGGAVTGFVDVPGHERLVHTMLAGAGGIDFALLVVAADDGVMPQTREHLAILHLLGLTRGLVALTKADLADAARLGQVKAEIRGALGGTTLAGAEILPVSALTGQGIDMLRARLIEAEAATAARAALGPARLSVDRSFTLTGAGTIVTGMALAGTLHPGDSLIVSPQGLPVRLRGLHAQNRKAEAGHAGQRCALNLAGDGVNKEAIQRGDCLVAPGFHAPADRIDARLTLLATEGKPLTAWFSARLHSHAAEAGVHVVPLQDAIAPGETGFVQLVLDRPLAAQVGDRFILRDPSASRTIGGGLFLDLRAPARHRRKPERLAALTAALSATPAEALRGLAEAGPVDLAAFLRDRGIDAGQGPDLLHAAGAGQIGPLALSHARFDDLRAQAQARLAAFHDEKPDLVGLGREPLRVSLNPRLPRDAFLPFLHSEALAGRLVLEGSFLRLPSHEVKLNEGDEALYAALLPGLQGEARFRPPRVRDFAHMLLLPEAEIRRVMRLCQRLGRIDQIGPDHYFHRPALAEMLAILAEIEAASRDGWITAAAFRDRVQNGRKVAIEILEYFDRLGVTLRRGDLRRINPHRRDQFDA